MTLLAAELTVSVSLRSVVARMPRRTRRKRTTTFEPPMETFCPRSPMPPPGAV